MKRFFVGVLTTFMLMGFGTFTEASQADSENAPCREYCYQDCDNNRGDYCGRYGCGQSQGQGYHRGQHHNR